MAFQRPLCFNRLLVCGFVIVRLYTQARPAFGLEHVYRHGFTFCRAFPAALHHRDGLRETDKVVVAPTVEQAHAEETESYGRTDRQSY